MKFFKSLCVGFFLCFAGINTVTSKPWRSDMDNCSEERPDCVCIIKILIRDLKNFLLGRQGVTLEKEIKDWKCERFIGLPKSIDVDGRNDGLVLSQPDEYPPEPPRQYFGYFSLKKKRKRDAFDKYIFFGTPTNEVFEEAIAKVEPNSLHQYVIFGSTAKLNCGGSSQDVSNLEGRVEKISWMHYDGSPLNSKAVVDKDSGMLEIPDAGLGDVDIYNCSISYKKEFQESPNDISVQTYNHQISVVTEPLFILSLSVKYRTEVCNFKEAKLIKEAIPAWIYRYVAKTVKVHHASVTCGGIVERTYKVNMTVSTLGLKFEMFKESHQNIKSCSISCLEQIQAKISEAIRDSMIKVFQLPIETQDSVRQRAVHPYVENSLSMELMLGCLPGFGLNHKLCFPCNPGYYTPNNSKSMNEDCIPCPIGTYQPKPATSECIPCPEHRPSDKIGAVSRLDCRKETAAEAIASAVHWNNAFNESSPVLIGGIAGGGSLVLIIVIVLISICFCCPDNGCGRCLRRMCGCKVSETDDDGENSKRKMKKQKKSKKEIRKNPKEN